MGGGKECCTPLTAACAPFWFTKNADFGTSHNKTTDSDEKIAVHKSDAILRLINMPLRMCRGGDM